MRNNRETAPQAGCGGNVAILLGAMNGRAFLSEQMDSIANQDHPHWTVWASDDGSTDGTLDMLQDYSHRWGRDRMVTVRGPSKGFAANFLSLACRAEIRADYCAFSDQDDVWEADKLSRALNWLRTVPSGVPALYCGRTRLIAKDGSNIGLSPLFARTPSFANALVQSIAGGNTMVFNDAARRLVRAAGPDVAIVSHDWWLYLLVSGCGGRVLYDPIPAVRYRQHEGNLVGSNIGGRARLARLRAAFHGRFAEWNALHIAALETMRAHFTPESGMIFRRFAEARKRPMVSRCFGVLGSGVHRQTVAGNLGLALASLIGKI
ncbi:MAG: glycosyltransferase family 2 protein [Magnetospirillum sp.]|nr:glycosyltransferase family 2 protein [Magnetospirillum sp.]